MHSELTSLPFLSSFSTLALVFSEAIFQRNHLYSSLDFPGGSVVKNPLANTGDVGLIPGLGRSPGEGLRNSLQYSCLENPQGQRSLAGYSPWGRKESDTTERLSATQHIPFLLCVCLCCWLVKIRGQITYFSVFTSPDLHVNFI